MGFGSFILFELDGWMDWRDGSYPLNYYNYYSTYSANKNCQGLNGVSQISSSVVFFDTVTYPFYMDPLNQLNFL